MNNQEYQAVKTAVESGQPISQSQYDALSSLNQQYVKHIKDCQKKNDIAQAMYFRTEQMEIQGVLSSAIIQKETHPNEQS